MDNSSTLRMGTKEAKDLIARHMLNQILVPMAKELIEGAADGRITLGHNMTGNTVNSYAAGVYLRGQLIHVETSAGSIPMPLRKKLGRGQRFYAGSQRWDSDIQEYTFTAGAGSNGATEPEQSIAFLKKYRAIPNGWELVVCNGVEYATYQEKEMNIDVLTANFEYAKMFAPQYFKPMPD